MSQIPWHFRKQVKEGFDKTCRMGFLEEVAPNTPMDYMAPLVITLKKNGTLRRTVDYRNLNKASSRQTHHTRHPYHLASDIPKQVKKTCYDSWNGYHSVPLEESS